MALSELTKSNIEDAKSHLRGAIRSAATNDSPTVVSFLARILQELELVEKHQEMSDALTNMIEEFKNGDNPFFK